MRCRFDCIAKSTLSPSLNYEPLREYFFTKISPSKKEFLPLLKNGIYQHRYNQKSIVK